MNCPNCNNLMENKSYSFWSMADWDSESPSGYHEEYHCHDCNIKYINGEWKIPKKYALATEKQIKAVKFINAYCFTNYTPLLKRPCISFIKEYLPIAQEIYQNRLEQMGEWHREEYGELDYY